MNIKTERKKLKLTQPELAELCGIGLNTLLNIEKKGVYCTNTRTLKKIADTFGVPITALFEEEE